MFLYKEQTVDPQIAYIHQSNGSFQDNVRLGTSSKAVFGRLTYAPTPEFRFSVGARQTWEDKSFSGNLLAISRLCTPLPTATCPTAQPIPYSLTAPTLSGVFPSVLFGPSPYVGIVNVLSPGPNYIQVASQITENTNSSFNKFTWRVSADWDFGPSNLLYASYETGFKAGGFFFTNDNPTYRPESIQAWTIGSKNRFMDNRLQLNAELFYWRYKDQQISHLGFDSLGTAIFPTENVGRATFKGVEIEAKFAATDTTTLSGDVQYLDARYNNFIYTTPNLNGGFSNGTACPNAAAPAVVYTVDCSGQRPPNAPKWTINLGLQQKIPVGSGEFVFDARSHYQSETLVGLEFLPIEKQDGFWLVDAALTYHAPDDRFYIGIYGNNLFDKNTISQIFPTPFSYFYSAGQRPPRTYGVRAGVNF